MHTREFPVLDEDDRDLVQQLSVGLGQDAARILSYLLLCENHSSIDENATLLDIRIGTDLNSETVSRVLSLLTDQELITETTISDRTQGRPPKAWHPSANVDETVRRVFTHQARTLISQSRAVATNMGWSLPSTRQDTVLNSNHDRTLTLALNWQPNALHAPFFVASATDEYVERGLSVEFLDNLGSQRAMERIVSEDADVAVVGATTVARARMDGQPIIPLAVLFQRTMVALYTTQNAFGTKFERVEQLRGCTVGMPPMSETRLLGRLFLSQAGVLDDVTIVDMDGEERTALESGRVDVATGSFSDPLAFSTAGRTVDTLLVADYLHVYGPTLVVTEDGITNLEPELVQFLAGTLHGWAETVQDPKAAVDAVQGTDASPQTAERAISKFATSTAIENNGWGWHQVDGWQRLQTALEHVEV
jgi:ABC-type nitrate/sulfonate/bicarbonate transport system substrate-binding protein/predicted transcriptional regulator